MPETAEKVVTATTGSKEPVVTKIKAEKPKKKVSLSDQILAKIKAGSPRKGESGSVEISCTNKSVLSEVKYVLTTGIEPFDDLVGPFPFGRITEIYGLESCGKTQLVIRAAARAQTINICEVVRENGVTKFVPINKKKAHVHILYIDNEQSIDDDEKIIVEGTALEIQLARCDTVDQLFKMADTTIDLVSAAQKDDPETLYFVLIVVDTIAATSSKEEMAEEWNKVDYSRHAKQYRQGFRVLTRKINRVRVAMICTNQVGDTFKQDKNRTRVAGLQDGDYATFGGRALSFFSAYRVFMMKMREYKINPKSRFPNGLLVGFKSVKNRIKKPYREGRMVLLFGDENGVGGGFSNVFSILETLIYLKCAEILKEPQKGIKFKFNKHRVKTTTFDESETSTTLDEDDDQESSSKRGKKDPMIVIRAEWPEFYAAHKADFTVLYQNAISQAFKDEIGDDDDSDDDETEEDEE